MISIKKYSSEFQEEWNDFIKNSKNGIFMFNRGFMDYHSDRFIDNSLMFYDNDELIALLPLSRHDNELRSHGGLTYGGFVTSEKMKQHKMLECFDVLKQYMQENGYTKLLYKSLPYVYYKQPSQEDEYALFKNNANLVKIEPSTTINLSNPCKMPKGRKAQISRAKREGVIIEESNNFVKFIDLENLVLSEHHNTKAVHTAEELNLLKSRFENEIQLRVAKYDNEIIAGTLLFVYENVVGLKTHDGGNTWKRINEVFDELGLPRTKEGQILGWVYDPCSSTCDNRVDFGPYFRFAKQTDDSILLIFI